MKKEELMMKEEMKESGITINAEILKAIYVINKNAKVYRDIANKLYQYINTPSIDRMSMSFSEREMEILNHNCMYIEDLEKIEAPSSYYEQVKTKLAEAPEPQIISPLNIRNLDDAEDKYLNKIYENLSQYVYETQSDEYDEIIDALEPIFEDARQLDPIEAKKTAEELKHRYIDRSDYIDVIDDLIDFLEDDIEMCNMFSECRNILEYIKDNHIVDSWRQAHQFIVYLSAVKKSLYDCKDKVLDILNIKPMEYHRFEVDNNHVYAYYIIGGFRFHLPVIDNDQPIAMTITGNIDSDYDDSDMPTIDEAIAILDNELDITYNGPSSVSDMQYNYSLRAYTYNDDIYDYDGGDEEDYGYGGDYDNGDD